MTNGAAVTSSLVIDIPKIEYLSSFSSSSSSSSSSLESLELAKKKSSVSETEAPKIAEMTIERIGEIFADRPQEDNQILIISTYFSNYHNREIREYFEVRYKMKESAESYVKGISLLYAVEFADYFALLSHLILLNASINISDEFGKTPLILAVEEEFTKAVNLLLSRKDCQVNAKDCTGNSALHIAASNGKLDYVTLLHISGADLDLKSSVNEMKALHLCAQNGRFDVCRYLIESGNCDVNSKDSNGWTPLHYASFHGCPLTVRLLLDLNCSKDIKDIKGRTSLEIANLFKNEEVVEILEQ